MGQRPDIEAIYPLSPMQQGMLFHILADGDSQVYFSQVAWTLPAGFDVEALQQAWRRVFERHSILRTAFTWKGLERPLQVVHRQLPLPWEEHDWRDLGNASADRLEEFLEQDRQRGFELTRAPVVRLSLIRLPQGAFAFVWSYLHLLLDGWSSRLVMREILDLQQAAQLGQDLRWPPSRPFKEYIAWLKTQNLAEAEAYWRRHLAGFAEPTPLPGRRSASAELGGNPRDDRRAGQRQAAELREATLTLDATATATLNSFARDHGLTTNTLVQGAWALLLGRHGGRRDVVFGATVSGRPPSLPGADAIAGLFINTLPVRVEIVPGEPLVGWLTRLQAEQARLRQYDYSPLVRIHEWSGMPADRPLFHSLLVFENYPVDERLVDGGDLGIEEVRSFESSNYPLNVIVSPTSELGIMLHYDAGRFEEPEIRRLLDHLESLLGGFVTAPHRPLAEISMLTPAEERQVRRPWDHTRAENPEGELPLYELFAKRVARTPDALAVAAVDRGLTFRELDLRSRCLARRLRRLGVGPEVRVGVAAGRSLAGILGRLAVLAAGGSFVPLDVAQPRQRLRQIARDAGLAIVLVERDLHANFADFAAQVLTLEAAGSVEASSDTPPAASDVEPDHLAYAIYTSGSTGQPKGVLVSQRAVNHLVWSHARRTGIGSGSRVLHLASPGFDVSVQETLASLCAGATVCLGSTDELTPGPALGRHLERLRVSALMLTPAVLAALPTEELPWLSTLIVGGESCRADLAAAWATERDLVFEYGPTEATVTATADRWQAGSSIDAGRPLAGVTVHLRAVDDSPAVPGAPGEILIGGPGVARGYLGRPARTALAFIPDLHSRDIGARLYRTGDLGRRRDDGRLEILGRLDHQVKIRGVRIEPGEIEAVLCQQSAVDEAIVVALPDAAGGRRLVAYVTAASHSPLQTGELREALRQALPSAMVPSAFVVLERMPVNASGKVDRQALPVPEAVAAATSEAFMAPRGPIEELVAALFAEVLGELVLAGRPIGRQDDFLDLGGHSLLAVRLASRIRQSFAVELALRELLEQGTVEALARRIEAARLEGIDEAPPIRTLPPEAPRPLSYAQERLWFLDQLAPGGPAYNLPLAWRLEGELDVAALTGAVSEIVRRHEVLRTRFVSRDGSATQEISAPAPVPLPRLDLSSLPPAAREAAARRLARREARQPFDLEQGPLLRVVLLRLDAEQHLLLATLHHIVTDGWSMRLLMREISALYRAFQAGQRSPLSELAAQYADYAAWQRDWLSGDVRKRQLDYWRQQLAGADSPLELPVDRPRQQLSVRRGARVPLTLASELTERLTEMGGRRSATAFMTLLAVFQALLERYSGQRSISVGTPVAGRDRLEVEELIGFFVNTLVLRTDLSGNPTFEELLARVREVTFGAYAHQELPFESLVDELRLARDMSRSPLFQVMLNLEVDPDPAQIDFPGLTLSPFAADTGATRFDLTLELGIRRSGIAGFLEYDRDLFDPSTAARMVGHFRILLAAVAADPAVRLSRLPLLTAVERHQFVEWSDTAAEPSALPRIEARFAAQARQNPDAVALVSGDRAVSYRELDRRAEGLAEALRQEGVGSESLVGLGVEPSPEIVVALLGVLKSGGAYLPLDATYPDERLAFMLEDAFRGVEPAVLVAEDRFADRLGRLSRRPLRHVRPTVEASSARSASIDSPGVRRLGRPASESSANHRAYVIFTSGSTGRPKGVEICHRAAVNFLDSMRRSPGLDSSDVLLAVTTLSFDISVLEVFLPLLTGARLVLTDRETAADAERLTDVLSRQRATVMQATPATWQMWVEGQERHLPRLRVLCGGEALPRPLAQQLQESAAGVWNLYGPTETTVWSSVREVGSGVGAVSVGRPIANTRTIMLDRRGTCAPVGVPAELCIGGQGLARGYLGRPALTAERLVPDATGLASPGTRLYRTGDLARHHADGSLEHLGRIDHQIKLRGFRIELGEIEARLRELETVTQAVVTLHERGTGDLILVGHVVAPSTTEPSTEALSAALGSRLPAYMVPSAWIFHSSLPLTPSGKVDRRALAELAPSWQPPTGSAPRTPYEELVAGFFAELLGVEEVSREDDFFARGGHSLLATRLLSRLRSSLGVDLPVRLVFEASTVEALAATVEATVEAAVRSGEGSATPAIAPRTDRSPAPLSFAQQRLWFVDQMSPGSTAYNLPSVLRLRGSLDVDGLQRSLSEVVRRHEALRTTFAAPEGKAVQIIAPPRPVALPRIDLRALKSRDRDAVSRRLVRAEIDRPFDLSQGPIFRAQLIRLTTDEHLVSATAHHIASDEQSMQLLIREVSTLYSVQTEDSVQTEYSAQTDIAESEGQESLLPELPIQYADYATWQRRRLTGDALEAELDYWRSRLKGAPELLELPTDRPRPSVRSDRGASWPLDLPAELSASLAELGQHHGATLFMTVAAAYKALLHHHAQSVDLCVGAPFEGRHRLELEGLIGFFVNLVPLRTDLSGDPTFTGLLARVREGVLAAYHHQELPFERLVDELGISRQLSYTPLVQAAFSLENAVRSEPMGTALRLEPVTLEDRSAKFDLTLAMLDAPEGLSGSLTYASELFDRATIARLDRHFQALLRSVVADPERRLSQIAWLNGAEQQQLLVEWNDVASSYPREASLLDLFEEQVRRSPGALAVVSSGDSLTYADLDRGATRLAHRLLTAGVGVEPRIGVCVEGAADIVLASLAALKVGGAYVPLDPGYPAERLSFMAEDSGLQALVTRPALAEKLPALPGLIRVLLDADSQRSAELPELPAFTSSPDRLAYVIYTSGSTGRPKGIGIPQQAVTRLVRDTNYIEITPSDRLAQVSNISFDAATFEIWGALLNGAALVEIEREVALAPEALAQALAERQVSVLFITTALFNQIAHLAPRAFRVLRCLLFGGEAVDPSSVRRVLAHGPPEHLLHVYGPTENTTFSTWYPVAAVEDSALAVPIGGPIRNTTLVVLDAHARPVPAGVIGELWLGGEGLAQGYLARPVRTAWAFIPDPWAGIGRRLYRTGDLVRQLPAGAIEFVGRRDHQVKVRGFRIELGEIEAALTEAPQVAEAVVLLQRDAATGAGRVFAYLVPESGTSPTTSELRRFLEQRLPDYMVPQVFVSLERLPLTPNGKVNRRALPAIEEVRPELEDAYVAPRSATEERLAAVWADVLGIAEVGVDDNFFELGGDSILSIQVATRATQAGLAVSARQLFQNPTVAELAMVVEDGGGPSAEQGAVTGAVPLTPIQRWFFELGNAAPHHFNQAVLLRLERAIDPQVLEASLARLLEHHDALRLRFTRERSGWRQEITPPGGPTPLTRLDLSRLPAARWLTTLEAAADQAQASLDLEHGPMVRCVLFERDDGEAGTGESGRLLIVAHHLVIDGVSWRVLLGDLEGLFAGGELPAKTTPFKGWAELLSERGRSDAIEQELDYWSEEMWPEDLEDEAFQLPVDLPAGAQANTVASAREVTVSLNQPATQSLLQDVPRVFGTRIQPALLSALARAFQAWSGGDALLLDVESHGRWHDVHEESEDAIDLSRTIGWFTAIYPLLLDLRGVEDPVTALTSVDERMSRVPGDGLGYGLLRYLGGRKTARWLRALPTAELSFNYHGQVDQTLAADSPLKLAPESAGSPQAPQDQRPYPLEIGGLVSGGKLRFTLTYSRNLHQESTIQALGDALIGALKALAAVARGEDGLTSLDLSPLDLSPEELEAALAAVTFDGTEADSNDAVEGAYALSPMQEGLLFHSLYEGGSGFYVTQFACRLSRLDVETFAATWREVIDREPLLRTAISWSGGGQALQVVGRRVELPLQVEDWSELAAEAREERFRDLLEGDRRQGFDLAHAPLMRLYLIRETADDYRLLWSHHHILLDGWSLPILLAEVFAIYGARVRGEQPQLPSRRPYRDYIHWLDRRDPAASERFWRRRLRGFDAATPLGLEPPRAESDVGGHAEAGRSLSRADTDRLEGWARRRRLTVSTVVQGAWAILLGRYGGQREVLFGSVESGRPPELVGVEGMVGLFINTLPLRLEIPDEASVLGWLETLQDLQAEQREHVFTPLSQIRKWSDVPAGQPLFETLVAFENYPLDESLGPGSGELAISDVQPLDSTHHALTLTASGPGALHLRLEFDSARCGRIAARRLLGHLQTLLSAIMSETIADDPPQRLGELSLLSVTERHQLLEWNATPASYPRDLTVHCLVEAQARRTPARTALIFEGETLTYGELRRRTDALAGRLRQLGVGPEAKVGICLERSPELVLGLLAILRAGAAYVPLDPSYPEQRLAFMGEDSGISVLLTSRRLRSRVSIAGATVLFVDATVASGTVASSHGGSAIPDLDGGAGAESLAYAIYTSGSTGRPKGAMNAHRGVVNRLLWMQQAYGLDDSDRVLQKTPFSFDVSVWEFFWPLITGAGLVIARPDGHRDPDYLADLIADERITTLHFVPSMLRAFLEAPGLEGRCGGLRRVIASGEALTADLVDRFHRRLDAQLHNLYGPTEAAVDVTFEPCAPDRAEGSVAIGRPVANTRIHLLDRSGRPVPQGVAGELAIGGVQVGRGYLGRPALTAERFVPDAVSGDDGRLYRTGDLARQLADGRVEFLGRLDFQVKIHGQRIELGEIEAALVALPAVASTVVLARIDEPDRARLVAYLVPSADPPSRDDMRSALESSLPGHMVPKAFVFLDDLPLTPSGKLDRRALPAPEAAPTEREHAFVAPRDEVERQLAAIWAEVLRVDPVGMDDDFFALGGDSILTLQVVSRAARVGLRLTPKQVFDHPTVARLSAVACSAPQIVAEQGAVVGPVALTPIQRWFFEHPRQAPAHFNQAVLLEVRKPLDRTVIERAAEHLLIHHDALRLRFERHEDGWRQRLAAPRDCRADMHWTDLSGLPADRRHAALEAVAAEVQASLDLVAGPVVRFAGFEGGAGESKKLLVVVHHLAIDGVSWRILLEDFEAACRALERRQPVRLPAKTTSFQSWSEHLATLAGSPEIDALTASWLTPERSQCRPLPVDHEEPVEVNTVASVDTVTIALDADETHALLREAPRAYRAGIEDVLLTAVAQAVGKWTGERLLSVDLETHGRDTGRHSGGESQDLLVGMDLSRTVGWFTAIHPLLLDLREVSDPGQTLRRVKEALRSVATGGLSYGLLRYLGGDSEAAEHLRSLPDSEVSFNYLGQTDQILPDGAWLALSPTSTGPAQAPGERRRWLLEIDGWIAQGQLRLTLRYSRALHRRSTIESLAEGLQSDLRRLITHCRQAEAGYTPSDFPLLGMGQRELERTFSSVTFHPADADAGAGSSEIEDAYGLSPMQEGLLFHSLRQAGTGVYVNQIVGRLRQLDAQALIRAWQWVSVHEPVLRTAVSWREGDRAVQVVGRGVGLPVIREDWSALSAEDVEERLEETLAADREQGFDPAEAPLMRLRLIQLRDDQHLLIWSHHHLMLDGWSTSIVMGDVLRAYGPLLRGEDVKIEPRRPYRDYIAWLESQDVAAAESFWRRTLEGFQAATPLGTDRAVGEGKPLAAGRELWLRLSEAQTSRIRGFAQRHQLTLSSVVQAAWALLLGRTSGEEEVVFGSVDSGRPADLAGADSMVGLFINTLPIRVRLPGSVASLTWLEDFQAQQVEQREFAYAPLVEIQRWSEVPAGQPLFESFVAFENYPLDEALAKETSDLVFDELRPIEATHFPLALTVLDASSLAMRLEIDAARFDPSTGRRRLGHLRTLLDELIRDSQRPLAALSPVSPAERHQLLHEWSDTEARAEDLSLDQLYTRHAERTPEARAAGFEGHWLTYGELMQQADALACHLRRLGVTAETPVAICLERSLEMLVAALGVLRAGGAYVPLDPAYPAARSAYVLADSKAAVLLSEPGVVEQLQVPPGVTVSLAPEWGDLPVGGSVPGVGNPEQLAYVIYTSGSTGRPKGVEVRHRAVVNFLRSMARQPGLGATDRLLSVTTLAFDIHVLELFLPLATGGRVEIAPRRLAGDGPELVRRLDGGAVSALQATPATWQLLLESGWQGGDLTALCGGEALAPSLAAELARRAGSAWNLYGPTETTVWSAVERLAAGAASQAPGPSAVSIGRPIDNTDIYLLDAHGQPLPVAAAGELYIGGAGLARGYRDRPAMTAERFVPDSLSGDPGARLYRTGDVASFSRDGRLEYLGRVDQQIKLRGFRIELGEIESVLDEHDSVAVAAVAVRPTEDSGDDSAGSDQLVAYLVPGSEPISVEELRRHLRSRLPEYMVPSAWVVLDAMPLTPNRKIDRRRLPAPEASDAAPDRAFAAPSSPLEEVLASIWSEVLGQPRIGREESFFDLGGHSLLATRVIARVREALGVELPLDRLFEAPTVAALADEISGLDPSSASPSIERVARDGDLPLSYSQQRLWFLDQLEPGTPAYNLPFAIDLQGPLDSGLLGAALQGVAQRHEVLRARFVELGGKPVQVIEPRLNQTLAEIDLSNLEPEDRRREAERLGRWQANDSFRLDQVPLWKAALLRLDDQHWRLLLTIHHMVVDGWSFHILLREVGALYDAFASGQRPSLPSLPLQYTDYAAWQSADLEGEGLERKLGYWRQQLGDGGSPPLELPTDRPRPPLQTFAGAREPFAVSMATAEGLRTLARRDSASLYMVLLAALCALLRRYTSQDDLSVGTFIAGRSRAELEDLIGFFVNTLVMRVDTSGDPSFRELLARARRVTLDAYAHQEVPFEKLIEELQPERDMSRPAFYQVMLVLQNLPQTALEFGELRLEATGSGGLGRANFDFTLWLEETDDGLSGYLDYNVDLFDASTARRLLDHFARLLEGIAENADRRLSELPLLPAAERRQALVEWGEAAPPSAWQGGVFHLFDGHARQTPEAPAVTWIDASGGARSLNYGQLRDRAVRLAAMLRRRGAGPEVAVAVCLERSSDLVPAVLGVLAAGSAYVPLDAAYAGERLGYMLRQSQARLLVTTSSLAPSLAEASDAEGRRLEMILLDFEEENLAAERDLPTPAEVHPASLAYTVYTSGSTGHPKGVMVTHGALENAFHAWQERYRLSSETRCHLQMASFSFDVWSGDLVRALCSGGRLVLCPREYLLEPEALYTLMVTQEVDAAEFVPAVVRSLVEHLAKTQAPEDARDLAFMRLMVVGSDIWYLREMGELADACGSETRVINSYGVSEATIDSTSFELEGPHGLSDERPVPIGRPFRGSRLTLTDAYGQPVPTGVPGEMYLAGVGLARGYHASPAMTAERFVPDRFAAELGGLPGSRLYRTGDRARFLPGGDVEFLGRIDDQVKVRGFRIEPGEVEAALEELPGVRHAVVLARGAERQEKRLVAYVVPETPESIELSVLRASLGDRLADYMVPSIFVTLDELPLTANGKVDRRALPEPDWSRPELAADYVAPRTASEEALAEIVQDLLDLERVGIYDSFFDLGGHSLLATQFLARIRELFDVDVPLRAIFERPTVATLAVTVEEMILAELQGLEDADFETALEGQEPEMLAAHVGEGDW